MVAWVGQYAVTNKGWATIISTYIHIGCSTTDPTAVRPSSSSPLPQVLVLTLSFQNHKYSSLSFCDLVIDNLVGGESGGRYTKFTKLQPNLYVYFVIGRESC